MKIVLGERVGDDRALGSICLAKDFSEQVKSSWDSVQI